MSFALHYGKEGVWFGKFSNFPETLVTHAISSRFGGVSQAPFDQMNLAMHNGDDIAAVRKNRVLFCEAIHLDPHKLVTAEQVHSDQVLLVDESYAGKGATDYIDAIKGTDALITNCVNLPLMLFFADCVPVLIVDPIQQAIGISHAGWKGTMDKIAQKTILSMRENFGTQSQDCFVGIGPSIGQCCYDVTQEVAEQFSETFGKDSAKILKPFAHKWKLDLWAANQLQLEEIGVCADKIEACNICTACNAKLFFSYRADYAKTGRIAAVLSLKPVE